MLKESEHNQLKYLQIVVSNLKTKSIINNKKNKLIEKEIKKIKLILLIQISILLLIISAIVTNLLLTR